MRRKGRCCRGSPPQAENPAEQDSLFSYRKERPIRYPLREDRHAAEGKMLPEAARRR